MTSFDALINEEISECLSLDQRQYLVGNLERPQFLSAMPDSNILIGVTKYQLDSYEPPHCHSVVSEYHFVISGLTEFFDLNTGLAHRFKKGDFFKIEPRTIYSQKSIAGTEILFIKSPASNDKEACCPTKDEAIWRDQELI